MDQLESIKKIAEENGCAFFGTSLVQDKLPEGFKHLPYTITLGMRYPKTVIQGIEKGPTSIYFHQYRTMNANLDRTAMMIQSKLLNLGYEAVYVPASQSLPENAFYALFSHKTAAVSAGLGFIGKNNLFIHGKFGPAVRLSTILTDMTLPVPKESERIANLCGTCNRCAEACPAGALYNRVPEPPYIVSDVLDAEKCSYTMKEKYQHIGRGAVCGICIAVCPFGK